MKHLTVGHYKIQRTGHITTLIHRASSATLVEDWADIQT